MVISVGLAENGLVGRLVAEFARSRSNTSALYNTGCWRMAVSPAAILAERVACHLCCW